MLVFRLLFLLPLVWGQCSREEVNPYFDRYLEEVGDSLKCCPNKAFPPPHKSGCGKKPKTCLWGQQKCGATTLEPTTSCECKDRMWTCETIVCPDTKCCDPEEKPADFACGFSGCTCCSDGNWVPGNSGPSLPPQDVCQRLDLLASKPCQCCSTPKPTDVECGRSGCHCCSDGEWLLGNSGPTVDSPTACGRAGLQASKSCENRCCNPDKKPSDFACGLSGCTCCSDGDWVPGNSGPSLPPEAVCQRLDLIPSKPCECCSAPKPTDVECGRSGCHCCSDGEWLLGNSGPTLDSPTACDNVGLQPSKPCEGNCCDPGKKPSDLVCGSSGCTCCSDGTWVPAGSSGPTLRSVEACKRLEDATPSKPCECCSGPKPTDVECGRSGCHCCSDGDWLLGNSGPTLDSSTACGNFGLYASSSCEVQCCGPDEKPSEISCGLSGCTCCSDGVWVRGNSGPSFPPDVVCKRLDLVLSKPCDVDSKCCGQKPTDAQCGRSGCTCCSDGVWVRGNSGPSLPAEDVCKGLELIPAKPCE